MACLKPNEAGLPNQCDAKLIRNQLGALGLTELARRMEGEWAASLTHKEFFDRYGRIEQLASSVQRVATLMWPDKVAGIRDDLGWAERDMTVGKFKVSITLQRQLPG